MSVSGCSKGRTGLKVVVRTTVPEAGHLWGNKLELSDEIQIQVARPARVLDLYLTFSVQIASTKRKDVQCIQTVTL